MISPASGVSHFRSSMTFPWEALYHLVHPPPTTSGEHSRKQQSGCPDMLHIGGRISTSRVLCLYMLTGLGSHASLLLLRKSRDTLPHAKLSHVMEHDDGVCKLSMHMISGAALTHTYCSNQDLAIGMGPRRCQHRSGPHSGHVTRRLQYMQVDDAGAAVGQHGQRGRHRRRQPRWQHPRRRL